MGRTAVKKHHQAMFVYFLFALLGSSLALHGRAIHRVHRGQRGSIFRDDNGDGIDDSSVSVDSSGIVVDENGNPILNGAGFMVDSDGNPVDGNGVALPFDQFGRPLDSNGNPVFENTMSDS